LQLIAIHLITLHNIMEYMQIAIIQTQAADCENEYLCHSQNFRPRLYSEMPLLQALNPTMQCVYVCVCMRLHVKLVCESVYVMPAYMRVCFVRLIPPLVWYPRCRSW
jgi:hypothetical protein